MSVGTRSVPPPTLSRRALNRALLARQLLLDRAELSPTAAVEHLLGLQAQEPQAPYIALWSRLKSFVPDELSRAVADRRAVRGALMRATIHLVTTGDWSRLRPVMSAVLARQFMGSQFHRALAGVPLDELVAVGRALVAEKERTRSELGALLASRWPEADPAALAYAVTCLAPVVQVPPRGLWRQSGQARWIAADAWLGRPPEGPPDRRPERGPLPADELLRRYLAAFGPATIPDLRAWCGLTGIRASLADAREGLTVFVDELGRELIDLPEAPLPDPATPAPPRFLAPFDNAILSHADRTRIVSPAHRRRANEDRLMRTFLVDGFVAGAWRLTGQSLEVEPFEPLRPAVRRAVEQEAERLLAFLEPDSAAMSVRIRSLG